jgi:mannose-6-phosphate isomerase
LESHRSFKEGDGPEPLRLHCMPFDRPLILQPHFVERIWGTEALVPFYPSQDRKIGESWLTAEDCLVENSELTLREVAQQEPGAFASEGRGFPLLIKLLFPSEKLSVQVHPDDDHASALPDRPRGKTECWYVLSAEPGAQVAVGFREPIDRQAVRAAIEDGSIESRLRMIPVRAGDMIFIDAGTVHAIGPGVVMLEAQQYSDITYRLWDYGRKRELHVDQGMAVLRTSTSAGLVPPVPMGSFDRLLTCRYFTVDRFRLRAGDVAELRHGDQLQILIALSEAAGLVYDSTYIPLPKARAVLLPRGSSACSCRAEQDAEIIRIMPVC